MILYMYAAARVLAVLLYHPGCFLGWHAWSLDWRTYPIKLRCSVCNEISEVVR